MYKLYDIKNTYIGFGQKMKHFWIIFLRRLVLYSLNNKDNIDFVKILMCHHWNLVLIITFCVSCMLC